MNEYFTKQKCLPRVSMLVGFFLAAFPIFAQDTLLKSKTVTTEKWYSEGWVWFILVVIAIVLILAFTRKAGTNPPKFRDKR